MRTFKILLVSGLVVMNSAVFAQDITGSSCINGIDTATQRPCQTMGNDALSPTNTINNGVTTTPARTTTIPSGDGTVTTPGSTTTIPSSSTTTPTTTDISTTNSTMTTPAVAPTPSAPVKSMGPAASAPPSYR